MIYTSWLPGLGMVLAVAFTPDLVAAHETWTQTQLAGLERSISPGRLTDVQREMARAIIFKVHEQMPSHTDRTLPLWIRTQRGQGNSFLIDELAKILWSQKLREHLDSDYFEKPWLSLRPKVLGGVLILDHLARRYVSHAKLTELETMLIELIDFGHHGVVIMVDDERSIEKTSDAFRAKVIVVDLLMNSVPCPETLEAVPG